VLDGTGLTTMPTYVQDLAFWLPLMGLAAWWLWRRPTSGRFPSPSRFVTSGRYPAPADRPGLGT
jgi:hypothetical protein